MRSYSAFGLGIHSEIPLPELFEDDVANDIQIRLGRVDRPVDSDPDDDDYSILDSDTVAFHTPQGGFRIESARVLTVDPSSVTSTASVRLVILGRALGAMLQWRGRFVLHASAVARDGRVVAFAGESGAGKSTTAASFLSNGYHLVADDLVAIDLSGAEPRVLPGFAQLKLWPDSALAHDIDLDRMDRVHERHEKRIIPLESGQLVRESLPLHHIFILSSDPAAPSPARTGSLNAQESLVSLLRNAYAPRIMRVLGRQGEHMAQVARIATAVKIETLVIDRNSRKHSDVFDVVAARLNRV